MVTLTSKTKNVTEAAESIRRRVIESIIVERFMSNIRKVYNDFRSNLARNFTSFKILRNDSKTRKYPHKRKNFLWSLIENWIH